MNFDEMFAPTLTKLGLEARPQQRHLGWAVVEAMTDKSNLVGEARTGTGKSFAYLVPAIFAAKDEKRTIVSTETTALQDQLTKKDLPRLHEIYGGFKFRSLKGRSWYLCLNRGRMNSIGSTAMGALVKELEAHADGGLGDGERGDIEKRLRRELTDDEWSTLRGSSEFCGDNACKPDKCFSQRARGLAASADIVVTNHAMLRTDADMRASSDGERDILGDVHNLVIDEAHTLEAVLVDGWTQTMSPWEISQAESSILDAMGAAQIVIAREAKLEEEVANRFELLDGALKNITTFFKLRAEASANGRPVQWRRENFPLCEVYLSGSPTDRMIRAMEEYETETPARIEMCLDTWKRAEKYIELAARDADDIQAKGRRKLRKGLRAVRDIIALFELVAKSMPTRDGIVMHYGVPHGVLVDGIVRMDRSESVRLRVVPLDVSARCEKTVWADRTSILLSATMTDPTNGTFDYSVASLGIKEYKTVMVDSPFEYSTQQLVYVTPADRPIIDLHGARHSTDELVDLIRVSNGRTLVLFTARGELEHAADELRALQSRGEFPWPLHVQEPKANKQKLADAFRSEEHSVLLATKSFFTGVDFPGSTCTTVAICKFPLPQYNSLCKQRISWWRSRGFPNWYERESLLVFAQAAGRLIRSERDHGVVALLDQRCADTRENVYRTSQIGIHATRSTVVHDLGSVESFLAGHASAQAVA